jgi:UDP-N-acetylglucosamine acyltransferase
VIDGHTIIGENTHVSSFASLGCAPQIYRERQAEATMLRIGENNDIREYCTISCGAWDSCSSIGSDNLIMAYSHIGHDSQLGSGITLVNGATLAGHSIVEDHAVLGNAVRLAPFCRVGVHAFVYAGSACRKDVLPYMSTVIDYKGRLDFYGVNVKGLVERGFSKSEMHSIRQAYKVLYSSDLLRSEAVRKLEAEADSSPHVRNIIEFIKNSKLGFVR